MTRKPYKLIIADNQFLIVESLAAIIGQDKRYRLSGIAGSVMELKTLLKENPDTALLIVDYFMLDFSGFEDLRVLVSSVQDVKVLVLTNSVKVMDVNELSRIGVKNILYKTASQDELFRAVEHCLQGKKSYSDEILDILIDTHSARDELVAPVALTSAETEITRLIASGLTTKEIAVQKHKSFHTVMSHRKNIFRKLNIKNTSELTRYAIKAGLIDNIEYYI